MGTPAQFIDKLNTYTEKYYSVLDDFSNSYINYKMYPGYSEHENTYSNNKAIIEALQADVFIATNDIQTNIDSLNSLLSDLDTKINAEKTKNTNLKSKLSEIATSGNGAELLIGESTDLYKLQRLSNITLAVGIFLILFILFKIYSGGNHIAIEGNVKVPV